MSIVVLIAVHVLIGWENRAFVPKSAIVMVFVVLVAIPWSILNVSNLICPMKRFRNAGELIAHVVFLVVIFALLKGIL